MPTSRRTERYADRDRFNKRLDDRAATRLFECAMALILCINVYNIWRYLF